MTRGKFAPSYKLPAGKDGAMFRPPIPRSKALGSSSIHSARRQKTKKTLTRSVFFVLVTRGRIELPFQP